MRLCPTWRLADRARAAVNKVDRTKAMVVFYLMSRELKKIQGQEFTLRMQKKLMCGADRIYVSHMRVSKKRAKAFEGDPIGRRSPQPVRQQTRVDQLQFGEANTMSWLSSVSPSASSELPPSAGDPPQTPCVASSSAQI